MSDEINLAIEKYWRDLFADEIEKSLMGLKDDDATDWFNEGLRHAARIVRYGRIDD